MEFLLVFPFWAFALLACVVVTKERGEELGGVLVVLWGLMFVSTAAIIRMTFLLMEPWLRQASS